VRDDVVVSNDQLVNAQRLSDSLEALHVRYFVDINKPCKK
jgi:hypothetical protein